MRFPKSPFSRSPHTLPGFIHFRPFLRPIYAAVFSVGRTKSRRRCFVRQQPARPRPQNGPRTERPSCSANANYRNPSVFLVGQFFARIDTARRVNRFVFRARVTPPKCLLRADRKRNVRKSRRASNGRPVFTR